MRIKSKNFVILIIGLFFINMAVITQGHGETSISRKKILNIEGIQVKSLIMNINVHETFVNTNISLFVKNQENFSIQSEMIFEIPNGAFITNLSLTVNENTFWGTTYRIEIAQDIYQNATQQGKSAILLTEISQQLYNLEFNVARLSDVVVSVYYSQRLIRSSGEYNLQVNYPNLLLYKPDSWSTIIDIESPNRRISKIASPTDYIKNNLSSNRFMLQASGSQNSYPDSISEYITYSLSGSNLGSNIFTYSNGTEEYFFISFAPVLEDVGTQIGKDFVFVIDISGSMRGTKLTQAKSAIINILNSLYIDDRVGIVKFSDEADSAINILINKSSSTDIDSLKGWVSALEVAGSTNILDGLQTGLDLFDSPSRPKILVLLTDGNPTAGITNLEEIESQFTQANNEMGASLYALGFGDDVDFNFLQRISRTNNGDGVQIPVNDNSLEALNNFYSIISTPLIVDIKVTVNSGVNGTLYPYFQPNIYQGSELFLVGLRSGDINIEITGQTANQKGSWQIVYSQNSSTNIEDKWVSELYAVTIINDLLTQIRYTTGDITPLKEKIIKIALDFGIVTPYTAITVIVPDFDLLFSDAEGNLPDDTPGSSQSQANYSNSPVAIVSRADGAATATAGFDFLIGLITLFSVFLFRIKRKKYK